MVTVHGPIVDMIVALIDENRYQYSLNSLSKDYLGGLKAETDLVVMKNMASMQRENVEVTWRAC